MQVVYEFMNVDLQGKRLSPPFLNRITEYKHWFPGELSLLQHLTGTVRAIVTFPIVCPWLEAKFVRKSTISRSVRKS